MDHVELQLGEDLAVAQKLDQQRVKLIGEIASIVPAVSNRGAAEEGHQLDSVSRANGDDRSHQRLDRLRETLIAGMRELEGGEGDREPLVRHGHVWPVGIVQQ